MLNVKKIFQETTDIYKSCLDVAAEEGLIAIVKPPHMDEQRTPPKCKKK